MQNTEQQFADTIKMFDAELARYVAKIQQLEDQCERMSAQIELDNHTITALRADRHDLERENELLQQELDRAGVDGARHADSELAAMVDGIVRGRYPQLANR